MSGFTKDQLDEQLVLIRKFQSRKLSSTEFDAQMSAMKARQRIPNEIRQRMLDARRKVDVWLGGEYRQKSYVGVGSSCQSAGYKAAKSGGSYNEAHNAKWKELTVPIEADIEDKRGELKACNAIQEIARLSDTWSGPRIEIEEAPTEAPTETPAEESDVKEVAEASELNHQLHPEVERLVSSSR